MSQPAPSPSEPPAAIAPPPGRSGWLALASAVVVFLGFIGYGLFAPTTYRATAQIVLKPAGGKPLALPASPPAAERLREVAIDSETLEQAAGELKLGSGASGQAAARQRLDLRFEVQSAHPDTFDFSFREATAAGAQHVTNFLARHAAARAVHTLAPAAPDEGAARDAARSKSAAELAAFMAAHPELTPQTPSVVPVAPKDTPDAEISSLRAERDQIQAKLAHMPEGEPGSDNPFGEATTASAEAKRMRRRLSEIDQTLTARKRTDKKADAPPKVQPQVEREWKRLVQAVAQPTVSAEQAPEPTFTVMLREATLPPGPIDPDRRMVALLGALASLVTAVAVTILQSALTRRSAWREASPPTPRQGSEPPRPRSDPPRAGSEPPRPRSDPPRAGSEPPRPRSDPPRAGSEPPRPPSDPPRPGSNPPREGSEPPKPGSTPPQPILAVGSSELATTQLSSTDPRRASSNPPPERHQSSNPPPARASSNPPPARTATGYGIPSPPPQVPTAVGYTPPSPPPPAASAPPARPTPGYEALRHMPPGGPVPKGTLVGMAPVDPRALDSTMLASPPDRAAPAVEEPFATTPSAREPTAPRSTLRPPPPDTPKAPVIETTAVTAEVIVPEPKRDAEGAGPEPSERDDSWTGPSRAHRRSVSAARRTTQMLGSPIPPVVRGSRPPTHTTSTFGSPAPGTPPAPGTRAGTGYSYVSDRPEAPQQRPPADTPPYYQTTSGAQASTRPSQRITPPGTATASGAKTRVTRHPARSGWAPDPSLDFHTRRSLADQLFPLAVESCFVLGVTAVGESRMQKSRVAAELALALAEPRHPRVLLLEGDFQWPNVHQLMRVDMPMSMGFSQQLRGRAPSKSDAWTVIECTPTLHVLAEGIMRSPGHILSVQFEESLRSLRSYYDLIVLDGPDATAEVECRALANVIDGFAMVAPASGSQALAHAVTLFPDKRFSTVVGV